MLNPYLETRNKTKATFCCISSILLRWKPFNCIRMYGAQYYNTSQKHQIDSQHSLHCWNSKLSALCKILLTTSTAVQTLHQSFSDVTIHYELPLHSIQFWTILIAAIYKNILIVTICDHLLVLQKP